MTLINPRVRLAAVLAAAASVSAACHRGRTEPPSSERCPAIAGPLSPATDLGLLAGQYDAILVATSGSAAGRSTAGRLTLRRQSPALVRLESSDTAIMATQPVIGTLDIPLEDVGAPRLGDLTSQDSLRPGIAVVATQRRTGDVTGLVARIGSESTGRGMPAMDGWHFTVFITRVDTSGIWGGWSSYSGPGIPPAEASGRFCAYRVNG